MGGDGSQRLPESVVGLSSLVSSLKLVWASTLEQVPGRLVVGSVLWARQA